MQLGEGSSVKRSKRPVNNTRGGGAGVSPLHYFGERFCDSGHSQEIRQSLVWHAGDVLLPFPAIARGVVGRHTGGPATIIRT